MESTELSSDQKRCPLCGKGVFTDVVYEERDADGTELRLDGDAREILMFSCGHEVRGAAMEAAEPDRMTVEQRESEETVDPAEEER